MTAPDQTPESPKSTKNPPSAGLSASAVSLGTNMAVGMVLFAFLGYWIDARKGGGVRWTLAGLFLGLLYAAYEVWKVVRTADSPRPSGSDRNAPRPSAAPP